jgi:hypothetical protein
MLRPNITALNGRTQKRDSNVDQSIRRIAQAHSALKRLQAPDHHQGDATHIAAIALRVSSEISQIRALIMSRCIG